MIILQIQTSHPVELIDITERVASEIRNVNKGICVVSTPHTTAGIIINENEAGLRGDIMENYNKHYSFSDLPVINLPETGNKK